MNIVYCWEEKHAKFFVLALLMSGLRQKDVKVGEVKSAFKKYWYVETEETDVVRAVYNGFMAGKKIWHTKGEPFPAKATLLFTTGS